MLQKYFLLANFKDFSVEATFLGPMAIVIPFWKPYQCLSDATKLLATEAMVKYVAIRQKQHGIMSPMIGWGDKIQILDFGTEHPKPKKMIFTKFEQCGMMGLGMF